MIDDRTYVLGTIFSITNYICATFSVKELYKYQEHNTGCYLFLYYLHIFSNSVDNGNGEILLMDTELYKYIEKSSLF